jgi:hypothetical protein
MLIDPIINYSLHFNRASTSKGGGKGDTKGLQIKFRAPSGRKVQMWDSRKPKAIFFFKKPQALFFSVFSYPTKQRAPNLYYHNLSKP